MMRQLSTMVAAMIALLYGDEKDPLSLAVISPVSECAELADIDLTDVAGLGSSITDVYIGTSADVEVCVVSGVLQTNNTFELLLPTETWEQRYIQTGCGGLCGMLSLSSPASDGCTILDNGGFAMATTNMGHTSDDGSWAVNDHQRADFAYLAHHLTARASKKLIKVFYGQEPTYSYFSGCSDGGREALMEAERYPEDFDGIVAGAPAMLFQVQNTLYHGWQARSNTDSDGNVILLTEKLSAIYDAVMDACDGDDGLVDGLISQPALCEFDPSVLKCENGTEDSSCLTEEEIEVVNKFYEGPTDNTTGAYLTAGQPQYGSESLWSGVYVASSADSTLASTEHALPVLRYLAFTTPRPNMTLDDLEFTEETLDQLRPRAPLYDATMADLSAFEGKGGKLLLWHGLSDPEISPANTVAFHKKMLQIMGSDRVENFERLYLLPGVGHCGSGVGPSNMDLLSAVMTWVEVGQAPVGIMTSSTSSSSSSFGTVSTDSSDNSGSSSGSSGSSGPGGSGNFSGSGAGNSTMGGGSSSSSYSSSSSSSSSTSLPDMTRPVFPWPFTAMYNGTGYMYNASSWVLGPVAEIVSTRQNWPGSNLFGKYDFIAA